MTSAATPVSAAAKQQHDDDDNQNQFHGSTPFMVPALFAAHRILQSTDCVLQLAYGLVGLACRFQPLVAEDLPGDFFHRSLGLLCRAFDSISIHCRILSVGRVRLVLRQR